MAWKHRKLMMSVGNAAQAACPADDDRDRLTELARDEAERVVAAAGIAMVSDETDVATSVVETCSTPARCARRGGGSTWQSLRRRTGDVETDYLNGEISMLGRRVGVPTPVNDLLRDVSWRMAADRAEPGSLPAADLLKELEL